MSDLRLNQIHYYLLAFGISFSSIFITIPISVSLTDMIILLTLVYSILFHQRIIINLLVFWFFLFVLEIMIVNLVNYAYIENFSFSGFAINYIRLIAAFLIILFVPSLTKSFNLAQFNKALLFVVKFHCILVFFDNFVTYPWFFDQNGININTRFVDHAKAQGLFAESSFFAAYTGLTTSLILQFQANSNKKILKPMDLGIIFIGMASSSSLTGILLALILLLQYCFIERHEIFKFTSFLKLLFFGTITSLILITSLTFSVTYLFGRLTNIEDGSTLQRMVGSTVLSGQIINERPLTGVGLGGTNFQNFMEKSENSFLFDSIETETEGGVTLQTNLSTYWSALLAGGGLPLLILFYIPILGTLVFNKKTMYVGVMIFLIGISKGGVFEISLWWTIATVLGFKYYEESVSINQ